MLLSIATLAAAAIAAAPQQISQEPSPLGEAVGRRAKIGRIDSSEAPRLDGRLDDACWAKTPEIGDLIQVEPVAGVVPLQRTVIQITHDRDYLYIAGQCFDDRPDMIRRTQRAFDARLDPDDRVEFLIDTFQNQNQGYFFQIGAGGSLGDGLLGNNSFAKSWDTIWNGRSRVTDTGWQFELRIPFRSIAFPDDDSTWNFNVNRIRRWTNEQYRWSNASQSRPFFRLDQLGEIDGFGEVEEGTGIDARPYVAFRQRRNRLTDDSWTSDPDAGGEVFFRLSPSMRAAVTFFTDFAETENDDRVINLTRFPVFFRERRDFFLEDESRFQFGPRSSSFVPFFSRRVGLGGDGQIPILAGAKIAGQQGPWEVGGLIVGTGEGGGNDFNRELGVVRINRSVAEETRVGVIGTTGRPTERGSNQVAGVDFFHREPEFVGDMDLRLWAFLIGSQTSGVGGDGSAAGVRAVAVGREWEVEAESRWVGEEFNPELGFVRRRDVKDTSLEIDFNPRTQNDDLIRFYSFDLDMQLIVDQGNKVTDMEFQVSPFGFSTHDEDRFRTFIEREFERVPDAFTIFDDIVVPAGDYWETRGGVSFSTSEARPINVELSNVIGDFYNGNAWELRGEFTWRTSPLLILGGEYRQTKADLFGRDFTSSIAQGNVDFNFTPWLSVQNLIQYDNQSRNLGLQSRTRWITRPGSDLFVVVTAGWLRGEDGSLRPDAQELAIKFAHTIRF